MPLKKSTRDLPLEVKTMPVAARAIFRSAFNSAIKEKPEAMASLLALAAVKKQFARIEGEEGEEWVKKEEAQQQREEEIAEAVGSAREGDEDEGDDEKTQRKGREAAEDDPEYEKATNVIKAARAISVAASEGAAADSDDIQMIDTMMLDGAGFRLTGDGYLVANPRVSRTGIQLYRGSEVGRPDMDEVRVYRPETEVFSTAAMSSLAHRPITLDHPDTKVDASNWRKLAVGKSDGDVARDGDFIRVPLVLMDSHAIHAAQSGKSQLSVGYGAKLVWEDGLTPDGQPYDAMQTEIRANHIALVTSARGGSKLKIGDSKKRARAQGQNRNEGDHDTSHERRFPMTDRTLNLDGVNIALDERDAQILERHLAGLQKKMKDYEDGSVDLEKKIEGVEADLVEATKAVSAKDGEIAVLKQRVEELKADRRGSGSSRQRAARCRRACADGSR